jgi:tetratricopeptide (TPR) repeat protein
MLLQVWTVPAGGYEQALDKGRSLLRQGQYRDAIAMFETVIPKAVAAHADAAIVAIVLNDLAESYRNLAEYAKAEPLYDQALALLRDRPEYSRQTMAVLNNKGTFYRETGSYFRASAIYQQSLELAKKAGLEHDSVMGATLNGMAAVTASSQGDLKSAQRLLERSLRIREATLGPDHLEVSETLNNLGVIYFKRKKLDQAEATLSRALRIMEQQLGSDHSDVAMTLSNLAVIYVERKQYSAAEKMLAQALDIRRRKLPDNHPVVADGLFNLAGVMMKQNRTAEAEPLLKQAVEIRSQISRASSVESLRTLERYADALRINGHTSDADVVAARARYMETELRYLVKP